MEARDELIISFDQNPAVADASKTWKVGDKVEPEKTKLTVKAINPDSVIFTVDAVIPKGFKEVDEVTAPNIPVASPSTPIPSMDAMMVKPT
jgi:hypothetical protein